MSQAPGPSVFEMTTRLPQLINDRLSFMEWLHSAYGDVVRIPMGPRVSYGVFSPEAFGQILVSKNNVHWKGRTFAKTATYLGQGLATSEGKEWQTQRRRINPYFNREALGHISEIMVANIETMLDRWEEFSKTGETFDAGFEFHRLVMKVVARSLFGNNLPEAEIIEVMSSIREVLAVTNNRIMIPFDIPESWPLPGNFKFRKAVRQLNTIVYRLIEEERGRQEPSRTLLGMLVNAADPETGESMSDLQIRDEVMTMFLAGTDTSGNTLGWLLLYLHQNSQVLEKVKEEVTRVLTDGRNPAAADFMQFGYIRRTIEETLRMSPQNWVMSRDSLESQMIGDYEIPADSTIFLGVYIAHRRADLWSDPLTFDPDRFLADRNTGRHPFAYLPFGGGPRKCIGSNFAMMEISFVIAMLVQRFDFKVTNADQIRARPTWSMWPDRPILAQVKRRTP